MINMWFTAMFLGGAYDNMVTSHGPCSPFLSDIAPLFLFSFLLSLLILRLGHLGFLFLLLPSLILLLFCLPHANFSPLVHKVFYVLLLPSWPHHSLPTPSSKIHFLIFNLFLSFLTPSALPPSTFFPHPNLCLHPSFVPLKWTPSPCLVALNNISPSFGTLVPHVLFLPIPPILSVPFFNPPFPFVLVALLLVSQLLASALYSGLSFLTLVAS